MIGILGIYYYAWNFGAQLQARALQCVIEALGHPCVWIRYDYKTGIDNPFVESNVRTQLEGDGNEFWKRYAEDIAPKLAKRKASFARFQDETKHTIGLYYPDDLPGVMAECDRLMIGGDQVWNDFYYMEEPHMAGNFTLDFVPDNQFKFTFSASTGGGYELSSTQRRRLEPGLKRLSRISCREKSSVSMLEELSGKRVECVLDSAFLLNRDGWNQIRKPAISISGFHNKFAVCCFMGKFIQWREASNQICARMNVDILCFPHLGESLYYQSDYHFGNVRDFTSGPAEFLDLIERAEFVITESFHACVFSIIYEKPFYVFLKDESDRNLKTNARIIDMLDEFGLSDRIITPDKLSQLEIIEPIDYDKVNAVLSRRKKESIEYLKSALNMEMQ